jgi:hypothetical protein
MTIEMLKILLFLFLENETPEVGPQIDKELDGSSGLFPRRSGRQPSGWG